MNRVTWLIHVPQQVFLESLLCARPCARGTDPGTGLTELTAWYLELVTNYDVKAHVVQLARHSTV